MVDTGAERSTVQKLPSGCTLTKNTINIVGAKGEPFKVYETQAIEIEAPQKFCVGKFLMVPEAEYNLLGRDLIVSLGINLSVENDNLVVKLYPLNPTDEAEINPDVWYNQDNIRKLDIPPIKVTIQNPERPIRVRQYSLSIEGRKGLKPIIQSLIHKGTLEPCMSPHNTPILPVKKPDGSFRLVQDLQAVNSRTVTRFPVVANPHTLLNQISSDYTWYSVVDLKDAF